MIKLKSLLTEMNIFNRDELKEMILNILKTKNVENNKEIVEWFTVNFLNWVYSSKDDYIKRNWYIYTKRHQWKPGEPDWAKEYDTLEALGVDSGRIYHIIDFFLSMTDDQRKRIKGASTLQVFELVRRWDIMLKKKMETTPQHTQEGKDVKVVQTFPDGFKIVKLLTKGSREDEGRLMGHCIGQGGYESGDSVNFSLRDSNGQPHTTMQLVNGNEISQIQGKENKAPIPKYIPYLVDFIEKNNYTVARHGDRIGYTEIRLGKERIYINPTRVSDISYRKELVSQRIDKIFNDIKSRMEGKKIKGDVFLAYLFLETIPEFLKDTTIDGGFYCSNNQLTSLENCPEIVHGLFTCDSNKLTSLKGGPKIVDNSYDCSDNNITSLLGIASRIGTVYSINAYLNCSNNQLTSLQGVPTNTLHGELNCSNNRLISLEGGPKEVRGDYNCSNNQLTSLNGCANTVQGEFNCSHNQLTSLKGMPKLIFKNLNCSHNLITSLEECANHSIRVIDCSYNKIEFIDRKHLPKDVWRFNYNYNPIKSLWDIPREFGYIPIPFDKNKYRWSENIKSN